WRLSAMPAAPSPFRALTTIYLLLSLLLGGCAAYDSGFGPTRPISSNGNGTERKESRAPAASPLRRVLRATGLTERLLAAGGGDHADDHEAGHEQAHAGADAEGVEHGEEQHEEQRRAPDARQVRLAA